jgi:hypothetical protein
VPVFFAQKRKTGVVAVTGVHGDGPRRRLSTATVVEDAFIVVLQLPEFPVHELWVDGNPQPVTGLRRYKENR